jgi:hypothetical protein
MLLVLIVQDKALSLFFTDDFSNQFVLKEYAIKYYHHSIFGQSVQGAVDCQDIGPYQQIKSTPSKSLSAAFYDQF